MLTVVAWNYLFWVALRVCKISGISRLSFPRFRHKLRPPRPSMNRVKVVPFDSQKYQFSFIAKIPLTPLPKSLFEKGLSLPSLQGRGSSCSDLNPHLT